MLSIFFSPVSLKMMLGIAYNNWSTIFIKAELTTQFVVYLNKNYVNHWLCSRCLRQGPDFHDHAGDFYDSCLKIEDCEEGTAST